MTKDSKERINNLDFPIDESKYMQLKQYDSTQKNNTQRALTASLHACKKI